MRYMPVLVSLENVIDGLAAVPSLAETAVAVLEVEDVVPPSTVPNACAADGSSAMSSVRRRRDIGHFSVRMP
jgi:hypothetical protein